MLGTVKVGAETADEEAIETMGRKTDQDREMGLAKKGSDTKFEILQ